MEDHRTKQLMTMHKGGRGFASIEDSADTSKQRFKDYMKKSKHKSQQLVTALTA